MTKEVEASSIKAERIQTRAATKASYIDELAERMTAGDEFPPIVIFTDGKESWVADGIHRLGAAIKSKKSIRVDYRKGTRQDAITFACGANHLHGMRRTNADKRQAATLALSAFPERSSRWIAELCAVGHTLVDEIRQVASDATCQENNTEETRVGQDGKTYPAGSSGPQPDPEATANGEASEGDDFLVIPEPPPRKWGDGDSLDDVQADLKELNRRCRELSKFVRTVLRCEENDITRPYCGNYSLLTVSHPLLHVARCVMNDLPVGGTPKKPILFHEEKAASLAK